MAKRECGKKIQTGPRANNRCVLSAGHGGKCRSVLPGSAPTAKAETAAAPKVDLGELSTPPRPVDSSTGRHISVDRVRHINEVLAGETIPHLSAAVAATQTAARGGRGETDVLGVPDTMAGRKRAAMSDRTGPAVLHQFAVHHGNPQMLSYIADNESAAGETLALAAEKSQNMHDSWRWVFPKLVFNHNTDTETLNFIGETVLDDRERFSSRAADRGTFEKTLSGLAIHGNTDVEMLLRIEGSRVPRYIRELAVENENFPAKRLAELAKKSKSPVILRLVASHKNTPPCEIGKMALNKKLDQHIRTAAVRNPFIEAAALDEVIAEGEPEMRGGVAGNISSPKDVLAGMLNGPPSSYPALAAAANLSTPEEALDSAFARAVEAGPGSHEWSLVGEMPRNPALSRKLADKMIDAQHEIAMGMLAGAPETHPEIVARIRAEAESKAVRYKALCTLEVQAGRPNPSKNVYGPVGAHPPRWEEA